jgi:hypothetical protein
VNPKPGSPFAPDARRRHVDHRDGGAATAAPSRAYRSVVASTRIEELRSRYHAVLVVRERRDHEVRDEFATHTVG